MGASKLAIVVVALALLIGLVLQFLVPLLNTVLGCAAKTLCSAVFVSHRQPHSVDLGLECSTPIVPILATPAIDVTRKLVFADMLYGLLRRTAAYSGPYRGCYLIDPEHPLPPEPTKPRPSTRALDSSELWPIGNKVSLDTNSTVYKKLKTNLERWMDSRWNTRAIVVVQNGKIVYEDYGKGFSSSSALLGWSMTKSLISSLVGILVKDGKLSLNQTFGDIIPEWKDDVRSQITLYDMLTMQSGLAWREIYGPVGSDVVPMLYLDNSVVERAIKQPLEVAPRTKWYYSSGTSNILSWIVRKVINDDNKYWTFPAERLFDKIGATSMVMEVDPNGTFVGSSFSYGTARDWARFGLLYLQNGLWNNERILPEDWVKHSITPTPNAANIYGAHWWLSSANFSKPLAEKWEARKQLLKRMPENTYFAHGYAEQMVVVVPSRNTVITRLGYVPVGEQMDIADFINDILSALD